MGSGEGEREGGREGEGGRVGWGVEGGRSMGELFPLFCYVSTNLFLVYIY